MTTVEPDPELRRTVLRRESARLADGLRGGDAALLHRQVPGLDWTAGRRPRMCASCTGRSRRRCATRTPRPRDAAAAAAPTVLSTMLPLLLDPERVRDRRIGFELRIRGGRPFVLRIADGRATAEPVGASRGPVDCVISLTGEAALPAGFARRPVWQPVATGAALSWGRRPWLGFPDLFLTV